MATQGLIEEVLTGAMTTAGSQLDREVLRRLAGIVGRPMTEMDENGPPAVLTHAEALHLEAIVAQFYLRNKLPDRIKRSCQTCTFYAIEDPAYLAQREEEMQRIYDRSKLLDYIAAQQLADSGHEAEAYMRLFSAAPKPSLVMPCTECGSIKYDYSRVTYCPECRQRREELLLVECPCGYDFIGSVREDIWTTVNLARQRYRTCYRQLVVLDAIYALDGWANTEQIVFLLDYIDVNTGIYGVARCSWVDYRKRNTLLLVTTEGIRWSSKRFLKFMTGRSVNWAEVSDAAAPNDAADSILVRLTDGSAVTFGSFIGDGRPLGIGVSTEVINFGARTIRRLASKKKTGGNA
jgi:hypothetical protein